MPSFAHFKTGTALMLALGLTASAFTPMIAPAPVVAQTQTQARFSDVPSGHWAGTFINSLASRGIIAGFPDGTFRPNQPVTRAEYAAMVRQAFNRESIRGRTAFVDVPSNYWAATAIQEAYQTGFMSGYPGSVFRPDQNIPRAQVLVSLANGLNYSANSLASAQVYRDAGAVPDYAVASIAAATENRMVVNYPNVQLLRPNETATRADVAAFIYQALASQNQVAGITSPYIVSLQAATQPTIAAGALIPVTYAEAEKIVVLPEETVPITLNVAQPLTDERGQVLVTAGSQIQGELRPSGSGSQFVAQELILPDGQRLPVNATSQTITTRETIRQGASIGEVLAGSILGSGAAAAIARTTGDRIPSTFEVLAGTATGAVATAIFKRDRVEVISINPSQLSLTLNAPLVLPPR